jgi:hypothetical protein
LPFGCTKKLLKKHKKNEFTTHFEKKFTTGSYRVRIGMLGVARKLVKYVVHLFKKKIRSNFIFFLMGVQIEKNQFLVSRILGVK